MERKYLPTLAELIDRLSIIQLKEVFIPENKTAYTKEIKDIMYDIDIVLQKQEEGDVCVIGVDAYMIRAIIVLAQMNLHIWHNESEARKGNAENNNLQLTHGLNGIRTEAKNLLSTYVGEREDLKVDCLAAEFKDWEISW